MFRDAAVAPAPDAADDTNVVPPLSDAAPPTADSAASASETAPIAADSPVAVPDAAPIVADSAVEALDTAPTVADSAVVSADATLVGDGPWPDSAVVLLDSARPVLDSGETAPTPYVNRTFRIDPQNPAPTPDPTCTQYREIDYIQMTFASDASTLTVLDVRGSAAMPFSATVGPESNKLTYHVNNFLGGGLITFEQDQGVYVAQVILYGSGVPIVQCLRGALTPQP